MHTETHTQAQTHLNLMLVVQRMFCVRMLSTIIWHNYCAGILHRISIFPPAPSRHRQPRHWRTRGRSSDLGARRCEARTLHRQVKKLCITIDDLSMRHIH